MIRTLNEVISRRDELERSIDKMEREMTAIRVEIKIKSESGEDVKELYKRSSAVMYSLTRLRGIKEGLDYLVNYDSYLNTDAIYRINSETFRL